MDISTDVDVKEEPNEILIESQKSNGRNSKSAKCDDLPLRGVEYVIETGPVVLMRNANNEYVTLSSLTDEQFGQSFGIDKQQFEIILNYLSEFHETGSIKPTLEMFCAISLYALSSCKMFQTVAQVFNVTTNTVMKTFHLFTSFVSSSLIHKVEWPRNESIEEIIESFRDYGIPNIIGVMNTCSLAVGEQLLQKEDKTQFFDDEKGCHAIKFLAVCNSSLKFHYIQFGFPASWSNSKILKKSDLGTLLSTQILDFIPSNSHLIADLSFPLEFHVMTPYGNDDLTEIEEKFNGKVAKVEVIISKAFDALKMRFKRLTELPAFSASRLINLVVSCIILHNICLEIPSAVVDDTLIECNLRTSSEVKGAGICESSNSIVNDELESCAWKHPTSKRDFLARKLSC